MAFQPGSEDEVHYSIKAWLEAVLPGAVVVHVPNGFYAGESRQAARHLQRLKALGLTPGAFDLLVFPGRGRVFWIEVKHAHGGVVSPEQKAFGEKMNRLDIPWAVCRSIDEAAAFLHAIDVRTREAA